MSTEELRKHFNEAIKNAKDSGVSADKIAEMELLREWFANPAFKDAMSDYVYELSH